MLHTAVKPRPGCEAPPLAQTPVAPMDVTVSATIADIAREAWDRCFADRLEGWDYYRAIEDAGVPGFEWRYFAVVENGRTLAVAPAFITEYRIDTTVTGRWKRLSDWLTRRLPSLMVLRVLALGSPMAEICDIGFAPEVAAERRPDLLTLLLRRMEQHAAGERIGLIGIKDAPAGDAGLTRACAAAGYQRMPGLPTARLDLPFADLDGYLARLSRATRRDVRRKLKAGDRIRIERRHDIDDVLADVAALYDETLARSALSFEQVPPAYFANVLRRLGPRASCMLYWHGDRLIGFNFLLHDDRRLIDKFLCTHEPAARDHNLYILSWIANVRLCVSAGLHCFQSGQADYESKLRLGSRLEPNWIWFRHRRPWLNRVLRLVSELVRLDRFDATVAEALGEPRPDDTP